MRKRLLLIILLLLVLLAYWHFPSETIIAKELSETIPPGTLLKAGNFTSIDKERQGQGKAYLLQDQEKYYLVLEQFKVTYSPELYVYLLPASSIRHEQDVKAYKEVGRLGGNYGTAVFEVPSDTLWKYHSIAIWDKHANRLMLAAALN